MSAEEVVKQFGIAEPVKISPLGSGHIHRTYKVEASQQFVLQRVNKNIFTQPDVIASNSRIAFHYLKQHHPGFLFPQALPDQKGNDLFYDEEGFPWRLYPLIENTFTIEEVRTEQEAYEAARGFAALSKNLQGIDTQLLKPTLERFHDLAWRYEQFEDALNKAKPEAIHSAAGEIKQAKSSQPMVAEYNQLISEGVLQLRIMHNDTKVNNILFDAVSKKAACAIDLDTLMPGYFIYDLGDMVRTCVSPVNEEEKDISKISFRENIYNALVEGYQSQMGDILTDREKKFIPFAGKMMIYIMALRFLADYLRGNTYYHVTYSDQNLVRARNQFNLLSLLKKNV